MEGENNNDSGAQDASATAGRSGFGSRLREAREALGMSVSQTAERLYCDPRVIAALESEDVTTLGADVYARGHLKRYSDFLKLPTSDLLTSYDQLRERPSSTPDLTRIARAERPTDPNKYLNWLYVILAGVLGAFVVYAVLQMPRGDKSEAAGTTTGAVITAPADAPVNSAQPDPSAAPPISAPPTATPAVSPPADANATPLPSAPAAVSPAVAAPVADGKVRLVMRASAECWTEVYDPDGRQLFFNAVKRGDRHLVTGQGPLRLVVGNAKDLRLEVGGRELTIPENLQRNGTALITIDADGRMESGR